MDVNTMSKSALQQYVERYAKVANKRLYNLEKYKMSKGSNAYRKIETYAFDTEPFMTKNGKVRFRESVNNLTIQQLRRGAAKIDFFLNKAQTSSVRGLNKKYRKAYNTFKQTTGSTMKFDDYLSFWADDVMRSVVKMYGSGIVAELNDLLASRYNETIEAMANNMEVESAATFIDLVRNEVDGIEKGEDYNDIKDDEIKSEDIK